ncbi:hypothetical protein GF407_07610 [candidate division KSB1 bacterium]|nr:hypothetical protein [candidate division KSB1 bacterium]
MTLKAIDSVEQQVDRLRPLPGMHIGAASGPELFNLPGNDFRTIKFKPRLLRNRTSPDVRLHRTQHETQFDHISRSKWLGILPEST